MGLSEVDFLLNQGNLLLLLDQWQQRDKVILLDAMFSKNFDAGEIVQLRLSKETPFENDNLFSSHAFSLREVLVLAKELNKLPGEITLILAQGLSLDYSNCLSPEVARAVPKAIEKVEAMLS